VADRSARLGRAVATLHYDETSPSICRIAETVMPGGADDADGETTVSYTLETSPRSSHLILRRGPTLLYDGDAAGEAAGILLDDLTRALVTDCRDGLVFHAAALADDDFAVIIPGRSGSGKTTLAAWMMCRGLRLLNDEVALVDRTANSVQSFARPLAIKPGGIDVMRGWMDLGDGTTTLTSSASTLVAPAHRGSSRTCGSPMLSAVIFPVRQQHGGAVSLEPLSAAETAFGLAGSLVNAANLRDGGFPDLVRLATRVAGGRLIYRDVEDLADGVLTTWLTSACQRAVSLR
jgi:hypothetical protein